MEDKNLSGSPFYSWSATLGPFGIRSRDEGKPIPTTERLQRGPTRGVSDPLANGSVHVHHGGSETLKKSVTLTAAPEMGGILRIPFPTLQLDSFLGLPW